MNTINDYLQQLVSASASALHLEPNKNPYVVTTTGNTEVSDSPLPGTQINTMIFSLLPADIKQKLPNSSQVEFVHPHNLGSFNFLVKKSPAGFNVTISPKFSVSESNPPIPNEQSPINNFQDSVSETEEYSWSKTVTPLTKSNENTELLVELNSPPREKTDFSKEESETEEHLTTQQFADNSEEEDEFSNREINLDQYTNVEIDESDYQTFSNDVEPVIEDIPSQNQNFALQPEISTPQVQTPPSVQTFQETPKISMPSAANPQARAKMDALFRKMAEIGASDLHLSVSMPPMVRNDGKMAKLDESQSSLNPDTMKELLSSIMPHKNIEEFTRRKDTDFAYEIKDLARFRANIFMDRKGMGGVFRIIPSEILTAEDLSLSKHILDLCDLSKGLVVVTGPTGSGKSTTLCAMVDYINKRREDHIITIEDPIEFTHENQKCLVNQREVHNHTDSFKDALRAALREDPDILLVGEMRDLETISIAIETAETGHLVFGTLHTTTASSTVDRIIDQFPADRQQQIRVMLSESLRGVIAQTLLPKKGGGRIAALEVLIVTPAISNLIREGKTFQIPSAMQTGKNKGMIMLNDSLMELVNQGIVEPRDAYIKAVDKTGFEMLLQRSGKTL